MKRIFKSLLVLVTVALTMVACMPEEDMFDETLLLENGKQVPCIIVMMKIIPVLPGILQMTLRKKKHSRLSGLWLKLIDTNSYYGNGGKVPKVYIVTELTPTTLKYRDDLTGKLEVFTKVE